MVFFFSAKMTNLKLSEQKKLLAEARVRRVGQSAKSDQTCIQTHTLMRKNMEVIKVTPTSSEPQATSVPPYRYPKSDSPKKYNTLMRDDVSQADMAITTLMHDSGNSPQTNPSSEFKFRSNSFDGLRYLYDHLNASEDVEKVKSIGAQHLKQNLRAYLMRCAVMNQAIF